MPQIRKETSPEQREAYLGDYAATRKAVIRRGSQIAHLLETGPVGLLDNEVQQYSRLSVDSEGYAWFRQGYGPHIHKQLDNPDGRRLLEDKAAAITAYNTVFKATIHDTLSLAKQTYQASRAADVYPLFINGKKYAVRVTNNDILGSPISEVNKHIEAGLRVKGIPHMEQIEAISYQDHITVAPFIEGRHFMVMTETKDLAVIDALQVTDLYGAMKQAEAVGVGFDSLGSNILYDSEAGFTCIDLDLKGEGNTCGSPERTLYRVLNAMRGHRRSKPYLTEISRLADIVGAEMEKYDVSDANEAEKIRELVKELREDVVFAPDIQEAPWR